MDTVSGLAFGQITTPVSARRFVNLLIYAGLNNDVDYKITMVGTGFTA